jgi:hypothetical protein
MMPPGMIAPGTKPPDRAPTPFDNVATGGAPGSERPTTRAQRPGAGIDTVIGIAAAVAIAIGALLDWAHPVNSMHIPVLYLFDPRTKHMQPRVGQFLLALALVAAVVGVVPVMRTWRTRVALIAMGMPLLYLIEAMRSLSKAHQLGHLSKYVGAGPWVAFFGACALAACSLFAIGDSGRHGSRVVTLVVAIVVGVVVVYGVVHSSSVRASAATASKARTKLDHPAACSLASTASVTTLLDGHTPTIQDQHAGAGCIWVAHSAGNTYQFFISIVPGTAQYGLQRTDTPDVKELSGIGSRAMSLGQPDQPQEVVFIDKNNTYIIGYFADLGEQRLDVRTSLPRVIALARAAAKHI